MKRARFFGAAALLASVLACGRLAAQEPASGSQSGAAYAVDHGPYLQGVTCDAATVMFTTSHKGYSTVEVRRAGEAQVRACDSRKDGLIMANNRENRITINGLQPATDYEYRIVSTRIEEFQPYRVTYGERIETPWYRFRTFDPAAETFRFVVMNDIHDTPEKCARLLAGAPLDEADMVFYLGDMMSYFSHPEQPYTSFIDVSVEAFARNKPFAVVRGNHETRGALARTYDRYICNNPEGRYYGLYTYGDTAVVMLDCGEDKPDDTPVYAGVVAFDAYREEQVAWLREAVQSEPFRRARHRIVMLHIPPVDARMAEQDPEGVREMLEWHGNVHWGQLVLPVLNGAGIDVLFAAHQHSFHYLPALEGVHDFPIVINDNRSAVHVCSDASGIHVRIVEMDGTQKMEHTF